MLVVEPTSSRFETADAGVSTSEHLLERISSTENRITRLAERLERSLDLVLRQAQNSFVDRSLLKVLVDVLAEEGLLNKERLEQRWTQECQPDQEELNDKRERPGPVLTEARSPKKRSTKRSRS